MELTSDHFDSETKAAAVDGSHGWIVVGRDSIWVDPSLEGNFMICNFTNTAVFQELLTEVPLCAQLRGILVAQNFFLPKFAYSLFFLATSPLPVHYGFNSLMRLKISKVRLKNRLI